MVEWQRIPDKPDLNYRNCQKRKLLNRLKNMTRHIKYQYCAELKATLNIFHNIFNVTHRIIYLMTKHPFFSDSSGRLVCATVTLSLAIVAVLLAAGCLGNDYQPNYDVGVSRLTPDGVTEWSVLVTTGRDTQSRNIIEFVDGSYILDEVIAEPINWSHYVRRPIKISRDGKIEWNQPVNISDCGSYVLILDTQGNVTNLFHTGMICPPVSTGEYAENSSGNFSVRGLVKETSDGGLILGGIKKESYFITKEEFIKIRINSRESQEMAEKEWVSWCVNIDDAKLNDACKSYPVSSTLFVRIVRDSVISWQRDLPDFSSESISITETKSDKGYIAGAGDTIIQLTPSGVVSNITQLRNISEYEAQPVRENNFNTYPVLIGSVVLRFDRDGRIISKESLPEGKSRTPTRDGGLLTVDKKYNQLPNGQKEPWCFAVKYNPDGSKNWTNTVSTPFGVPDPTRVIQTSDGGYVILTWGDNQTGKMD